jgi:hypothetical protein
VRVETDLGECSPNGEAKRRRRRHRARATVTTVSSVSPSPDNRCPRAIRAAWPELLRWLAGVLLPVLLALSLAPASAEPAVIFRQVDASVAFPEAIEFRLEASAEREVTRLELLYRPVSSPVTTLVRPSFQPGRELNLVYRRDMRVNYLPPGIDIYYRWRLSFADGSWVDSPEQVLLYLDQRYSWSRFERGPVTVFSAVPDPAHGQAALRATLEAIDRFQASFGFVAERPIRLVVYGSQRDLLDALPAQSAEWIGGIADPDLHVILAGVPPGPGAETELRRILSHEVVHLMVAQATRNPFNSPPAWLDEGLATLYQTVDDPRMESILQRAVREGRLIPVRALNSSFPVDPDQALLSYAESRSVVQFIVEQLGEERMAALLQVFCDGVSYDEAVQQALGMTIDELDAAWKAWLGYQGDRVAGQLDRPTVFPPEVSNPMVLLLPLLVSLALASMAQRWLRGRAGRRSSQSEGSSPEDSPEPW